MSDISNMGLGVMISYLSGNDKTVSALQMATGKTIKKIGIDQDKDRLYLRFTDDSGICLFDDGQSCCEVRYMTCDDDVSAFIGGTFEKAEIRNAPDLEADYGVYEQQFLLITTSKGVFTVVNHNEHNGYYGGFALVARIV